MTRRVKILTIDGVDQVEVQLVWDPPWNQNMISEAGRMKLGGMVWIVAQALRGVRKRKSQRCCASANGGRSLCEYSRQRQLIESRSSLREKFLETCFASRWGPMWDRVAGAGRFHTGCCWEFCEGAPESQSRGFSSPTTASHKGQTVGRSHNGVFVVWSYLRCAPASESAEFFVPEQRRRVLCESAAARFQISWVLLAQRFSVRCALPGAVACAREVASLQAAERRQQLLVVTVLEVSSTRNLGEPVELESNRMASSGRCSRNS